MLAPHLCSLFATEAPQVTVSVKQMWLPAMTNALQDDDIDVAITCGIVTEPEGVIGEVFAAEPLLVGLRPGHRLTGQDSIQLAELAHDVLGRVRDSLFPAWALIQQQALGQPASGHPRWTWKTPTWPPAAGWNNQASTGSCSYPHWLARTARR